MLDFPTSPTVGQVFQPSGLRSWKWDGTSWSRLGGKTAPARNSIINPGMQISEQYGDTARPDDLTYMADQWRFSWRNMTYGNQQGGRVALTTPKGSSHRVRVTILTATPTLTTDAYVAIVQPFEGFRIADWLWGLATGKQLVVQFGFRAPAGTYSYGFRNRTTTTRCWNQSFVVTPANANTDQYYTFIVPPSVDGNWRNGTDEACYFSVTITGGSDLFATDGAWIVTSAGQSKFVVPTQTNGAAVAGNTFDLFDVGVYVDPDNTGIPPEFQIPHYEEDLRDSQRYWYRLCGTRGVVANTTVGYVTGNHPVPMRGPPAYNVVGSPRGFDLSIAPALTAGMNHQYVDTMSYYIGPRAVGSTFTVGRPFMTLADGGGHNNYISANARM